MRNMLFAVGLHIIYIMVRSTVYEKQQFIPTNFHFA